MITTADQHVDRVRIGQLREDLRRVATAFCGAVADLEPLADELVHLDACLRAAECRAGTARRGPSVRALATDVLCGRLRALRPDLQYVSLDAAEISARALQGREPKAGAQ